MKKTTRKAIRETCATNITNYSFDQANDLMNAHTLRTVAMSFGVYGMNGALFEDENGDLYKITARNSTLFQMAGFLYFHMFLLRAI